MMTAVVLEIEIVCMLSLTFMYVWMYVCVLVYTKFTSVTLLVV